MVITQHNSTSCWCWLAAPSLCKFMHKYSCKCSDISSREYHFCRKYRNLKEVGRDTRVL